MAAAIAPLPLTIPRAFQRLLLLLVGLAPVALPPLPPNVTISASELLRREVVLPAADGIPSPLPLKPDRLDRSFGGLSVANNHSRRLRSSRSPPSVTIGLGLPQAVSDFPQFLPADVMLH
jgi:hypothetical protein